MNILRSAKSWIAVGLLAMGALGATSSHALVVVPDYDAARDFSTTANGGSNVWSYGYSIGEGSAYSMIAFDAVAGDAWNKSGYVTLGTPAIWKNTSSATQFGVAPGQLSLHPGPVANGDFAILRFTAPTTQTYSVTGQFYAGDSGDMRGSIIPDGNANTVLQFFPTTTDASVFAPFTLTMHAGQTLDFVVGNKGSFYFGNTPISVQIFAAAVPEPETYAMLLVGLGLIGRIVKRRKVSQS